jgi:hypothetical protein
MSLFSWQNNIEGYRATPLCGMGANRSQEVKYKKSEPDDSLFFDECIANPIGLLSGPDQDLQ